MTVGPVLLGVAGQLLVGRKGVLDDDAEDGAVGPHRGDIGDLLEGYLGTHPLVHLPLAGVKHCVQKLCFYFNPAMWD